MRVAIEDRVRSTAATAFSVSKSAALFGTPSGGCNLTARNLSFHSWLERYLSAASPQVQDGPPE